MATAIVTYGKTWTLKSIWERPNSRLASILRADPTAEDASALLGACFWPLPAELFEVVVLQLLSSVDVMALAAVSSLWRMSVWRALARNQVQLRAAARVMRARFPCLTKGNAKQLRWPIEFDDVAPAVVSHQPWLKCVSWDDFKTAQAGVAAFLAQDARPPMEAITCSEPEELFAMRLPTLADYSVSVRLLHGSTLIGSHDGPVEFKMYSDWADGRFGRLEAVFDLYALDVFASDDGGYGHLMPYDRSRRAYYSRYGPEVKPYPVNSVLHRVFQEWDDPLHGTYDKLRVVVFLTLGSKTVRVLDSLLDGDEPHCAPWFSTTQDLPLALVRAEHVADFPADEEFPVAVAAGTWSVDTLLMLKTNCPERCSEVRLAISLIDGDDVWEPNPLFLRRLFAARLGVDSDFDGNDASPAGV